MHTPEHHDDLLKRIERDLKDASDKAAAEAQVKEMCEKLLANTVIESYRIEVA